MQKRRLPSRLLPLPKERMASAITLSFVCGRDISSRLIAWWGNGYEGYSHVDAILPDGSRLGARDDEVDGIPPGVQIRPHDYGKWIRRKDVEIQVSDFTFRQWLRDAKARVGSQYDSGAIVDFILGSNRFHNGGHWICSAYQTELLVARQLLKHPSIPFAQITPNSLLLMVSQI